MKICRYIYFSLVSLACFIQPFSLFAIDFQEEECESNLMRDLLIVNYWNECLNDRLPTTYNHLLQGGYFNMPSARMGVEGEIGAGFAYVPPYHLYNLRFQLIDCLELSFNYRVFKGIADPILGEHGFGDYSDKGANIKFSILRPEDSHYTLPGVAIGCEDFLGTRSFKAQYIVLTQVFLKYNMELSLGYGKQRIRGWFGGLSWMPFRTSCNEYLQGFSLSLEYDATPYWDEDIEKHPDGRVSKCRWNYGIKYRLWDCVDLSLAYIRGDALAFTASTYYNFGNTKGFLPKYEDSLPYRAPLNIQPISYFRPIDALVQDLIYALRDQCFDLTEAWLSSECEEKVLRLVVINGAYRQERLVRERLNALLAGLIPLDIDRVIVTIETGDLPVQEYWYYMSHVRDFRDQLIGRYELNVLTPMQEVSYPNPYESKLIFKKEKELWNFELLPKTNFLFGSARGKFKYALGLTVAMNGFLYDDLFYSLSFGYFFLSNLYDICDVDRLNPSQIINVRTDVIKYYQQKSIIVDEAYVQKTTNLGCGWYARSAIGLFEVEYGGAAGELLYYPVNSNWAVGVEGAILKKRTYKGVGFTDKIRKLDGFVPHWRKGFIGKQYFLNLYYDWEETGLEFKISAGKFLANDYGSRFEISRYYESGLRIIFWYTYTNAHDYINDKRYQDKGVGFSVPLDIFYSKSSRSRWGYGMSAWLRDVGVRAFTGPELYYLINEQRQ